MDICERAHEIVEFIQGYNQDRMENLDELLRLCESPAEQILLAALFVRWDPDAIPGHKRLQCLFSTNYPACNGIFMVICEMQKIIKPLFSFGNTYRADLYFYLSRFTPSGQEAFPELARLIVEVDGHDFHDRTKHQASYDRKRDRELTLMGYHVIRFTGSDVYNDPLECVEDIDLQLNELARMVLDNYRAQGKLEELIFGP
jgi:hypothetical protein